ncbi:MAG: DUF4360 domain-containing protein [Deltaproteobacteria bacterium]|nr:MAG: DUF4360 domain-containing protein [Deltaproteobacteria bacterium]TNF26417.1 MAG: DUF4360 domain-containing protein [Deltaproteobacteria bacterium]
MKKTMTSLLALLMLSAAPVQANDDISLGEPGYGGSGCPQGSASAILSPDGKSLSILFDEFMVEAGGATRKTVARKTCNIAIPVHVPQGFSVSIVDIDYRGFNSLPSGASSQFTAEYFFAGQRGPRYAKSFRGALDDEFLIQNRLGLQALVWSKCGADVNLRVNASMMVRTNRYKQDALAMVDSADVQAGIRYQLQWKRCDSSNDFDDFYY